ncbi:sulfatase [Paenibacillus radicis (ex Xue et al. 2023)]|uniref:Sulfatase n=1 Tax=Paenibacillus radicis (ex Xue et al. 2023) TaxID=2972489 RepID=A0ABT1YRM8_9BACL|nr:sulfatase [Paenibacillus radicis (ex Xue et al. 2023)]MCR8635828.1 sulfatase [Paenibacillus radicis (ex Xue et al. 2023)]
MSKPNIVYIMSDDHCANAISIYGSRIAKVFQTPNLDRIGKEGAVLKSCFCTNAICSPSRASIITGLYPHKHGVKTLSDALDPELDTYPKRMQAGGYQTALVGKWHLHGVPQGFDYYEILPGQGEYFSPYFLDQTTDWEAVERFMDQQEDWSKVKNYGHFGQKHEGYVTDLITDKCVSWLEQRDQGKPFMLMCHHKAPHDDFEYHPRYERLFDDVEIPEPESLWEDKGHRSAGSREYGTTVSEKNPRRNAVTTMSRSGYPTGPLNLEGLDAVGRTKAAYQKYLKDYLRVVKGIDDNVGRLLDYLDKEGLAENTIVIYTSDQGMFLGEHDYIDKRWIFEESLQMPMLIKYPQEIKPGSIVEDIVTNVDFAPTLLDYAGLDAAANMQGRSFRKVIEGQTPDDWPNKVYYRYWMHMAHHDNPAHYGIRTKEYKLIFFYGLPLDASDALPEPTPASWELYDLRNDREELANVYDNPAYANVAQRLKEQLFEMKTEVGDGDDSYPELLGRVLETR